MNAWLHGAVLAACIFPGVAFGSERTEDLKRRIYELGNEEERRIGETRRPRNDATPLNSGSEGQANHRVVSSEGAASNCATNLSSVSRRFPAFRDPILRNVSAKYVGFPIMEAIGDARARGQSASALVGEVVQMSQRQDAEFQRLRQCSAQTSSWLSEEGFLAALPAVQDIGCEQNLNSACVCGAIAAWMGSIFLRAAAGAIACHARAAPW